MCKCQAETLMLKHNEEADQVHEQLATISEDLEKLTKSLCNSVSSAELIEFVHSIKDKVDNICISTIIRSET